MTRIALIGAGSFIARQVCARATMQGLDVLCVGHDAISESVLEGASVAINCAIAPRYRAEPYAESDDVDLEVARLCAKADVPFVMLSSRRVYPEASRWGANEEMPASGDETVYGRNKARTETAVRALLGPDATILRLSNIFGFEYGGDVRRTFFGMALRTLKERGEIIFDMAPRTQRDFLPVEQCGAAILEAARRYPGGIFNVGGGFPIACEKLALWVIEGFGRGKLVSESAVVRDAFYLDTTKWRSMFGALVDEYDLRRACVELGQRLR
jgi:nucleoside-diphosphate-sugar epimerase